MVYGWSVEAKKADRVVQNILIGKLNYFRLGRGTLGPVLTSKTSFGLEEVT